MVKIATDNLTFVNTGRHIARSYLTVARIKEGLNRLERYGTFDVHPSEQRTRFPEDNVNVVFDFSGVTYVDPRLFPMHLAVSDIVLLKYYDKLFRVIA